MQRCRTESVSSAGFVLMLVISINICCIFFSIQLRSLIILGFVPFWLWLFLLAVRNYLVIARKYTITATALVLIQYNGKTIVHPWSTISEIGICRVRYHAKDDGHAVVFRIVIGQEENGPSSGFYGPWATELYELNRWKRIITIPYSESLHQVLLGTVPVSVNDYRHIKKNAYSS